MFSVLSLGNKSMAPKMTVMIFRNFWENGLKGGEFIREGDHLFVKSSLKTVAGMLYFIGKGVVMD